MTAGIKLRPLGHAGGPEPRPTPDERAVAALFPSLVPEPQTFTRTLDEPARLNWPWSPDQPSTWFCPRHVDSFLRQVNGPPNVGFGWCPHCLAELAHRSVGKWEREQRPRKSQRRCRRRDDGWCAETVVMVGGSL